MDVSTISAAQQANVASQAQTTVLKKQLDQEGEVSNKLVEAAAPSAPGGELARATGKGLTLNTVA